MSTTRSYDIPRNLQNLEEEVDPENYAAVEEFIDHSAAEGIGESQQQRLIYSFKTLLTKLSPDSFTLRDASEDELKQVVARVNRSSYAEPTKAKFRAALKKFYKVENGGHEHPDKVGFFSVHKDRKTTSVSRKDLLKEDERKQLFQSFSKIRDRAFTMVLYESAARPGELLQASLGDFSSNEDGDFIYLEGLKATPDRTNQLVRSGRTLREWINQHPCGGELGNISDPDAPLWVKTEQQSCRNCGEKLGSHESSGSCDYVAAVEQISYKAYVKQFKSACRKAEIPENKRRPYNLRHTRLTEVATFMGYEQLNKFAGWKPGSDRAKVYVHLNNDDVNQAIRDKYGLDNGQEEEQTMACPFCGSENEDGHSECRTCGRPLSVEKQSQQNEKQKILERLAELEEKGILDKLNKL